MKHRMTSKSNGESSSVDGVSIKPPPRAALSTGKSSTGSTLPGPKQQADDVDHPKGTSATELEDVALSSKVAELEDALRNVREEIKKLQEENEAYKVKLRQRDESPSHRNLVMQRQPSSMIAGPQDIGVLAAVDEDSRLAEVQSLLAEQSRERAYWARKHEEVHRDFMKAESEKRVLQASMSDRDARWKREWERKNEHLLRELDRSRDRYHAAQKASWEHEKEAQELRRQVLELKHSISTSTRMEGQITDDVFRQKMQTLGHDIQNWTITNFRKAKLDVHSLPDDSLRELSVVAPNYERLIGTHKLNIIQAIVANRIASDIFSHFFAGTTGERLIRFQWMYDHLIGIASMAKVNEWRSLTLGILRQVPDEATNGGIAALVTQVQLKINNILSILTGISASEARDRTLASILETAIHLSRLFQVQRAQFKIETAAPEPMAPALFDSDHHEDISGQDDRELAGRPIECTTFPGVVKIGDEDGVNFNFRNVIVKANVLCRPD
ncbi:MAG: hypothetical protein M1825_000696 [Sarcosagium campestre]|nr:MAG: hypothetical protein M1825_000696 [Sarcosagium campestre]